MSTQIDDQVIRYVRDELDLKERDQFEQQIAADETLRSKVAFERQLQAEFKRPVPNVGDPDFSQIEHKLGTGGGFGWLKPAVSVAFACTFALAIFLGPVQSVLEPSFETLTTPVAVEEDILRVTLSDQSVLDQLQTEYEFEVKAGYPELNTFDLVFPAAQDLSDAVNQLTSAAGVSNVELIRAEANHD